MFPFFEISRGASEWYKNRHRPRSAHMKVYTKILNLIVTPSLTAAVRMEIKELEEVKIGTKISQFGNETFWPKNFKSAVAKIE